MAVGRWVNATTTNLANFASQNYLISTNFMNLTPWIIIAGENMVKEFISLVK